MSKTTAARSTASRAKNSRWLEGAARVGYVTNGILHLLIGGIALGVAFGGSGSADQSGALRSIASAPGGVFVLWLIVVGMAGLALLQLLEALLERGSGKEHWMVRAKAAGKAVAYLAVGLTALPFALGGSGGGGGAEQGLSAQLLASPGGVVLLVVVGLGVLAIGVYYVARGAGRGFVDDVRLPTGAAGTGVIVVGTAGYVAKGIAIGIVGSLFVVAAVTADPSEAAGLDGALKSLTGLPFGVALLAVVAVGLILFGLYCFARARLARL